MALALLNSIAPQHLINVLGVAGVLLILFAETGLLVGFFLPGDSLLFVAGYATVAHNSLGLHLPMGWLIVAAAVGSVVGSEFGWAFGWFSGERLLARPHSRWFRPEYVDRTRAVFERFGPARAVALARLVPVVRTLMNPLAGIARMPLATFTVVNVVSGLVWVIAMILLGHYVGQVSFVRNHIDVIAVLVVLLSIVPVLLHLWRDWHRRRTAAA